MMLIPPLPDNPTEVVRNDRGFARMPELLTTYGATVQVYESSAATHQHLWVCISEPRDLNAWCAAYASGNEYTGGFKEARAHMSVETAEALILQLRAAIDGHYQWKYRSGAVRDAHKTVEAIRGFGEIIIDPAPTGKRKGQEAHE